MERYDLIGKEVHEMVDPEARRGKMLPINQETAANRIITGRAFYEERDGKTVSFGTFDEMSECVEVRSIVTDEAFREHGLATRVTQKVILGAQKLTDKPIVALCNSESRGLMRKLGLRPAEKTAGFSELWQECRNCAEYGSWPGCHCQYVSLFGRMYEKNGNIFSVIDLSRAEERDFEETAKLYCEIWKEPPWNETDWQPEEVERDFKENLAKENGLALIAVHDGKIVGFTSGWNIGPEEVVERTDGMLKNEDFNGQDIFYIAELATGWQYRQSGIGKQLSLDLIARARANDTRRFLLRTSICATAARTLYRSLGFTESQATDAKFTDRTYWVL